MNKIRLGVIYGGKSGEHEVSIMSADSVINAIDTEKYDITRIFISKEGWWTIAGQPLNPWACAATSISPCPSCTDQTARTAQCRAC